jgi:hypothetical protein
MLRCKHIPSSIWNGSSDNGGLYSQFSKYQHVQLTERETKASNTPCPLIRAFPYALLASKSNVSNQRAFLRRLVVVQAFGRTCKSSSWSSPVSPCLLPFATCPSSGTIQTLTLAVRLVVRELVRWSPSLPLTTTVSARIPSTVDLPDIPYAS